jgi:hypothetical protein
MKKCIILVVVILYSCIASAQHKLIFRPSVGLSKVLKNNNSFTKTISSDFVNVDFTPNDIGADKWFPPQFGFMLEYQWGKHHSIAAGITEGKVNGQHSILFNGSAFQSNGSRIIFTKYSIDYGYKFTLPKFGIDADELLSKFRFTILNGFSIAGDDIESVSGGRGFSNGGIFSDSTVVNSYGATSNNVYFYNPGMRIGIVNNKNIERFNIAFVYELGVKENYNFTSVHYINGVQNQLTITQKSRGSQFKISASVPITLFDFDKKRKK